MKGIARVCQMMLPDITRDFIFLGGIFWLVNCALSNNGKIAKTTKKMEKMVRDACSFLSSTDEGMMWYNVFISTHSLAAVSIENEKLSSGGPDYPMPPHCDGTATGIIGPSIETVIPNATLAETMGPHISGSPLLIQAIFYLLSRKYLKMDISPILMSSYTFMTGTVPGKTWFQMFKQVYNNSKSGVVTTPQLSQTSQLSSIDKTSQLYGPRSLEFVKSIQSQQLAALSNTLPWAAIHGLHPLEHALRGSVYDHSNSALHGLRCLIESWKDCC